MQFNKSIRGKLFNYFRQRFKIKKSTKGWYRLNCLYCGKNYTMAVNFRDNHVKCFACEEHSTPLKVLMEAEKFDTIHQVRAFLQEQEEFEAYSENDIIVREHKEVRLPEGFQLINKNPDSILGKMAYNYLTKKRKFNLNQLARRGVGFCTTGEYKGYIIFPFYKMGRLFFFQGRKYNELGVTKMKNPSNEEFGIGKTEIIYNSDALYMYRKVYLVESITNAMTLGDTAFAILGKKISEIQLRTIISSPAEMIVIILDGDAFGEAIYTAMLLCQFKKVKVVRMVDDKDVNDLGRATTLKLARAASYGDYRFFLQLKLDYEGELGSYN